MHFLRQLIKRVIHHRRPVMAMWWSLYLPQPTHSPSLSLSVSFSLLLSVWLHRKSIGHKKAVALTLARLSVTGSGSGTGFVCCMLITLCYVLSFPPSTCLPLRFYLYLHSNKHASHTHVHYCSLCDAHTHTHVLASKPSETEKPANIFGYVFMSVYLFWSFQHI